LAKAQLVQAAIERGQGPVFMKSFEGDRLSASGQIDQIHPSSTNGRVRFVLSGQYHISNRAGIWLCGVWAIRSRIDMIPAIVEDGRCLLN
jgi:hypothetical protein